MFIDIICNLVGFTFALIAFAIALGVLCVVVIFVVWIISTFTGKDKLITRIFEKIDLL